MRLDVASATTNTCLPLASRSSAVCSTHTWHSMPQRMTCPRCIIACGRHSAGTQEKCSFSTTGAVAQASFSRARVGPRPLGYCSENTTGKASRAQAATSHSTRAVRRSASCMAPISFSCTSTTSNVAWLASIRAPLITHLSICCCLLRSQHRTDCSSSRTLQDLSTYL